MAEYLIQDTTLHDIADAVRAKTGKTDTIFLADISNEITNIQTGIDTSDATATTDDMAEGVTAYVNGEKVTGNVVTIKEGEHSTFAAVNSTVSETDNSSLFLCSGKDTTGNKLLRNGACADVFVYRKEFGDATAEDVAAGKTFTSAAGLKVTGIHECPEGGIDTSDATATADDIASGKTAYVSNGEKITGTLTALVSAGGSPYASDDIIGLTYNGDKKYILEKGTKLWCSNSEFGDATAEDVAAGKTFTSAAGLKVTGTHECAASEPNLQSKTVTPSESQQTVSPDSGYDGLSDVTVEAVSNTYVGSGVTKKSAATYTPGTADQTIASGQYLSGAQTIKGDANLVSANIKDGVSIFGVSGTCSGSEGLTMQSGATTSQTIDTGLSTIKYIVIYKKSISATGFIQGIYFAESGNMRCVYCSSYSSYMKSCSTEESSNATVSGSTFTWSGTGNTAFTDGVTYYWYAFGT